MKLNELLNESIKEQHNKKNTEELDEVVIAGAMAGGFIAGIGTAYLGYRSKRAFDALRNRFRQWLNDPFGFKRREMEATVNTVESDISELIELVEQRDRLIVQGDDMTVRQMKEAKDYTIKIKKKGSEIRQHFIGENSDKVIEYLGRDQFREFQQIISDAEQGEITFDKTVAQEENRKKNQGRKGILATLFGDQ